MKWLLRALLVVLIATPAFGQQTGSIVGKVTMADGSTLPGVSIQATANVLPQPRNTVSGNNGEFRLPLLPPGKYEVTFTLSGMGTVKRAADVVLRQDTIVNASLALASLKGEVTVVATASLLDTESSALKAAVTDSVIKALPVGQDYRDLVKLVPGVQYTEDGTRGPSAGGSGQDNTYAFDGVNVTLPLFGTLSAEPSSHDIEQVAVVKGGADATDFNRSAGISINTVSRSGTNAFHGSLSYQIQPESTVAKRETTSASVFDEDKSWAVANIGGPIVKDRLFFYGSYYRPESTRENRANLYGDVPDDYENSRNEFFGKLTYAPAASILLNGSYRTSDREEKNSVAGEAYAASTSNGYEAKQKIAILEGSWIINDRSYATAKFTDFRNPNQGRPDTALSLAPSLDGSVNIDPMALDRMGLVTIPVPVTGQTAYNAFIAPIINRYGYVQDGVSKGGGRVGGGSQYDNDDFYRQSFQLGYDVSFGKKVTHNVHVGYQYSKDQEDLYRTSNAWGLVTVPGGRINCPTAATACAGRPVYYQAQVQQQGILDVPTINSQYVSHNIELNDSIRWSNVTVNVGLLMSNDLLYGQGLREKDGTVSGFEVAQGNKYQMHEIGFGDALQPRLGIVWAYSGANTVYGNFARYVPTAGSLPRAASWARNSAVTVNAYFDADGKFIGSTPEAGSSGKIFVDGLDPRKTDEYMIGTTKDLGGGWNGRIHGRYRKSDNFWEDTNNDARLLYNPPEGIPRELYIPNLAAIRNEIGGSSYVIAALDGAFTKYYEAGLEAEWRGRNAYVRGSYVWSHYYGNFDQDNSAGSGTGNDSNIFIGSSNIGDGAGRQLWNFKYGDLRGDRRHQFKVYGSYTLPWKSSVGAYAIYQSGQPWEYHSYEPYISQTTSTSDSNRYAEPAGSRTTDDHYQLDLNFTHAFPIGDTFRIEARVDVFNIFDNQTGYNVQDNVHTANPGTYQTFYDPRRFQFALKLEF
ncbi:MAG: carboxypeptidase regulatory-like domain-containing protein [Holophagales bacterium]|nr:carboxypeptidase regulatory-like domain-containing protein [Holophagales bacterium]